MVCGELEAEFEDQGNGAEEVHVMKATKLVQRRRTATNALLAKHDALAGGDIERELRKAQDNPTFP